MVPPGSNFRFNSQRKPEAQVALLLAICPRPPLFWNAEASLLLRMPASVSASCPLPWDSSEISSRCRLVR